MKTDEKIKQELQTTGTETNTRQPELTKEDPENNLKIYQDKIYFLVDDFIDREYPGLTQEELINAKGFFDLLLSYLSQNYVKGIVQETSLPRRKLRYNITVLDNLFNIYKDLCYKYKKNNRPTLVQFCIFVNISKDTLNNWINNMTSDQVLSPEDNATVRKWVNICESALVDGSGEYVKEIFLLKASHGYQDNNNNITVTHKVLPALTLEQIPDTLGNG